jgi:uncharacterized protein YdeI (YjbR/CyaY-like superfamily)
MDADIDTSRLKREINAMPEDVRIALEPGRLGHAYRQRPPYQQNDYISWITRAKLPATRAKRLAQMLDELDAGGAYMHMSWKG